jgi:Flp pilus assembly protein TadG
MRDERQKGVALVLGALMLLVLVPMIGLGIDGGVAYLLRTKLSAAVDAAVLAGARSLSAGADIQSQAANATAVAQKYFDANFPTGTWGSQNASRSVTVNQDDNTHVRWVTVTASVDTPLYFMAILNQQTAHISLTGTAKRRDVNVMLVLDRSWSMGAYLDAHGNSQHCGTCGAIPAMINAATSFVNRFAQGRDKVGMVVFGGDYYRVLPSTDFSALAGQIAQITSSGNTGSAQALWQAYDALGNIPDQNGNPVGEPGALNVLLFFTDGLPNGITANFAPLRVSPNTCSFGSISMLGWISQTSGFVLDPGTTRGLFIPVASAVSDPNDGSTANLIANRAGCNFAADSANMYLDFTGIPAQDYYGNLTNPPNPYKPVDLSGLNRATQVAAASFNAADYAAQRMRGGAINNVAPLVYSISLLDNPAEPPDPVFMKRVSNTVDSPIYDSTKPTGLYIDTQSSDQLTPAFQRIASEILRLSQ